MIGAVQNLDSLHRLLAVARADARAARVDLADIALARQAAEGSLSTLKRQERCQKPDAGPEISDALKARRHNLQITVKTLMSAMAAARNRLKAAEREMEKLERLLEARQPEGDKAAGPKASVA